MNITGEFTERTIHHSRGYTPILATVSGAFSMSTRTAESNILVATFENDTQALATASFDASKTWTGEKILHIYNNVIKSN